MDEKLEEPDMSQRHKAKSMDPEKLAFVQKYLEDVHDTRSMTTDVSDSGLGTHSAVSELGTEEMNGKLVMLFCWVHVLKLSSYLKVRFFNFPVGGRTMNSVNIVIIHDFHDGGGRADLERILHANEAKKASRRRKQNVYEGF